MTRARVGTIILRVGILCAVLGTSRLYAGDFSSYRGLALGMDLNVAAKQTGTKPAEVRLIHQRPALIQEMDWQPCPPVLADPVRADPVKEGLLCVYKGELFRVVVTYDR